jgi:mRNA interferase MazF
VQRGEFYRVRSPRNDAKDARVFLIVARSGFVDAPYSSVMCAPVYTNAHGIATEVPVGPGDGLRHDSVVRCDEVTSVEKRRLVDYVGSLPESRMREVNRALAIALDVASEDIEDL